MPKYSLDSVAIDGFRGLRNLRLDDLGLINILVGKNDSGKTSVLEALSILCNPLDPLEWAWMVYRRDFGGLDESRLQSLQWCFPQTGKLADPDFHFDGACSMSCDGSFPLRKLEVSCRDVVAGLDFQRDREESSKPEKQDRLLPGILNAVNDEPDQGVEIEHVIEWVDGELETIRDRFWERLPIYPVRHVHDKRVKVQSLTPYSYQINQVQVRSHSWLQFDPDSRSSILDLIREFDPDVRDIKVASMRGIRPAIYLDHRRLGAAPMSIFGDGLRRAVLLASTLLNLKDGGILLIDEMEAGIHVRALQRVFAWLTKAARKLRVQIVATTHSLEAVDGIVVSNKDSIDDVVTFHLDQAEHETRAKRIYGDLLLRLRYEGGLDVR
jgi:energy-coupling factor transporter ATP-binding protein EcfA2